MNIEKPNQCVHLGRISGVKKQLDKRLQSVRGTDALTRPPRGWIKAVREALGLTTAQMARRMGVSQPRVVGIEKAEKTAAITLATLERAAQALDCRLVYTLVPRKSLEQLIEDRARQVAKARIQSAGHTMALEAQSVDADDEKEQLEALVRKLIEKAGSGFWKDEQSRTRL